jgi:restriction endonuclease S subunit
MATAFKKIHLSDICTIQLGYTPRGALSPVASGGEPAIQLRDLAGDGPLRPSRYELGEVSPRYLVEPADVLFRSRGDRNTAIATAGRLGEPAFAILPIMVLRPKRDLIEPRYLAWAINQAPAQRYFDTFARGTRLRMIPRSALELLEIDLPDLQTQRDIVELDALAAREEALAKLAAEKRRQLISLTLTERVKASEKRREGKIA